MSPELDGFWLPKDIREQLIHPESEFDTLSFVDGHPSESGTPGAISARWPRLKPHKWEQLIKLLDSNRRGVPRGIVFWERLLAALAAVGNRLSNPSDLLTLQALGALPGYTGYSQAMIRFTLNALELINLADIPNAFNICPTWNAARQWQPMAGLPGTLHFYPRDAWSALASRMPSRARLPLFGPPQSLDFVTGFGAGNVPGTALLIALLASSTTLQGNPPPLTVIKNSRREPIFSPLVLSALEEVDPELFAATAVLVWDYEDAGVQQCLLPQTDLVIAAASDESISQIQTKLAEVDIGSKARFHAHGHKVSFSAIGRDVLKRGLSDPQSGARLLDILALLAGLDSVFWDQHGCLSSRLHFIESSGEDIFTALEYAQQLSAQLSILATHLPRGNWPLQQLHDRFDRYKILETTGQVQVCSSYEDEFVVILDRRQLDPDQWYRQVNECQGRVIIVRPVTDLMEIPDHYLRLLPASNLQSLSVGLGKPGQPFSAREFNFARACGARGVTAIRSLGRGAFPQLAYSWDGLVPMDLTHQRPAGHFTTIEFDQPYEQILEIYRLLISRAGSLIRPIS